MIGNLARTVKHDLRMAAASRPWCLPLFGLRPSIRQLVVSRKTDIVIEGYPRSANTFTVVAFRQAQGRDIRIAHHLHAPAQLLRAAEWGIPSILLIREPEDAIVSLMVRHPKLDSRRCLRDYLAFYTPLIPVIDLLVVADFSQVTRDLGKVIRRVNDRYAIDFTEFVTNEESVGRVFAEIDTIRRSAKRSISQIAIPSQEKNLLHEQARVDFRNLHEPEMKSRAKDIYMQMRRLSGVDRQGAEFP